MINPSARQAPFSLVVISAGTSDPSSTRMLADRVAARVAALAGSDLMRLATGGSAR